MLMTIQRHAELKKYRLAESSFLKGASSQIELAA